MSKFTPGPWEAFTLDKPLEAIPKYVAACIANSGGNDFYIVEGRDEDGVFDVAHVGNGPRGFKHAHLIAAAPELYEALSELLDKEKFDDDDPRLGNARLMARAALAKANGEQP